MTIQQVTKPHKCCARCGLTPYEARRPENKECWAPGMHTKYIRHFWIWWEQDEQS